MGVFQFRLMDTPIPVLLNNSSMIILYKALLATSRISLNVWSSPVKSLSSQLTLCHVKRISGNVTKRSPKWHVLVATPLGIFLCNGLTPRVVGVAQCKARSSASQQLLLRKAQRDVSSSNIVNFNWTRLVKLMLPDMLLLAGAVVVSKERRSESLSGFFFRVQYLLLLSISKYHFCWVT